MHSWGLTTDGKVYCWGDNTSGQLGDGSIVSQATPVAVQGSFVFARVSAGYSYACGITGTAAVCWGRNIFGQLGDGTATDRSAPVLVNTPMPGTVSNATLSTGGGHACVVATAHMAFCWGLDKEGEIGNGTTTDALMPAHVAAAQVTTVGGRCSFERTSMSNPRLHHCGGTPLSALRPGRT